MLSVKYKLDNQVLESQFNSVDELNEKLKNEDISILEMTYKTSTNKVELPLQESFSAMLYSESERYALAEAKKYDKPHGAKLSHAQLNQFFNVEAPKYASLEQVEDALQSLYKKNNIEFTGQGLKQVISNYKKRVNLTKQAQNKTVKESETIDEKQLSAEEMKKREEIVKSMKKNFKAFKRKYGSDAKSVIYATATSMAKKD